MEFESPASFAEAFHCASAPSSNSLSSLSPSMRALVVLPQPPLLEGGAPGRCSVALLRGLRKHGITLTALAPRRPFAPHERLLVNGSKPPPDLPVEVLDVPLDERSWTTRVQALMRPNGHLSS